MILRVRILVVIRIWLLLVISSIVNELLLHIREVSVLNRLMRDHLRGRNEYRCIQRIHLSVGFLDWWLFHITRGRSCVLNRLEILYPCLPLVFLKKYPFYALSSSVLERFCVELDLFLCIFTGICLSWNIFPDWVKTPATSSFNSHSIHKTIYDRDERTLIANNG